MLTVWSVLWGDKYPPVYAYRLRDMVARHLSAAHRFVCVTDQALDGAETVEPIEPWHGWWQKLTLFEMADGPSIYFDLDVVIVDQLDYLECYANRSKLAAPANWGQSGHGGIQSSVMAWNGVEKAPYNLFRYGVDDQRLWGDQEFLSELYGDDYEKLPGIYSYKYHCQNGPPSDCSVAVFHGKPDPHEVKKEWVTSAWRSTPTHS